MHKNEYILSGCMSKKKLNFFPDSSVSGGLGYKKCLVLISAILQTNKYFLGNHSLLKIFVLIFFVLTKFATVVPI